MSLYRKRVKSFVSQMRKEQLPEMVIDNFCRYYRKLWDGDTGVIPERSILPVTAMENAEALPSKYHGIGEQYVPRTAIIKLNGGLGTSMGMKGAKSLLRVKSSLSFMDIIVRQARYLDDQMPVLFMNSFSTRQDTMAVLEQYPELRSDIPNDFLQHKIPKVNAEDLSPAIWPENPRLEWCPPGHGDIYAALVTSNIIDRLLAAGYEYAFVSNADNLGAVVDPAMLGYFVEKRFSFMMEVADRTNQDKKGGHVAQLKSGGYLLREVAQCADEDMHAFQDIERHRYFNTNNIWLHLPTVKDVMARHKGLLPLPMIKNKKTIDPRNAESAQVIQLETAMGSAISVFPHAGAIRVPRTRFAPVKSTNDLLAVRSDCYTLTDHYHVVPNPACDVNKLNINLDSGYYKRIDDFERRFPFGAPSLVDCNSLLIKGDFNFGSDVKMKGSVSLINGGRMPFMIGNQLHLQGELRV